MKTASLSSRRETRPSIAGLLGKGGLWRDVAIVEECCACTASLVLVPFTRTEQLGSLSHLRIVDCSQRRLIRDDDSELKHLEGML